MENGAPAIHPLGIIERVTHAFQTVPGQKWPQVTARTYQASLTDHGLQFIPRSPGLNQAEGARFRTLAISRSHRRMDARDGDSTDWFVRGNTAQTLRSEEDSIVEHYETRGAGVSVTWVLRETPRGDGPFIVEAELTGLTYAGRTKGGLHFADATGIARVCLGPVQLVDARNHRKDLDWQADGQGLRLEVPAAVLAQATYPFAIDPLIFAEFGIDEPVNAATPATQYAPAVAVTGDTALVTWTRGKGETTDPGHKRDRNRDQAPNPMASRRSR